jgi:hypothetical protein
MYVEGGGEGNQTKAAVREGFQRFLQDIVRAARSQKVRWQIVACGPRRAAFENFLLALDTHPDAFNVLLVDSEGPVNHGPKEHLKSRDGWNLPDISAEHYHREAGVTPASPVLDIQCPAAASAPRLWSPCSTRESTASAAVPTLPQQTSLCVGTSAHRPF